MGIVTISVVAISFVYIVQEPLMYKKNHSFLDEEGIHGEGDLSFSEGNVSLPSSTIKFATSTQFVVFAFDGSKSNAMWKETMDFADEMRRDAKPLSFTYFINPIYLLTKEKAKEVYAPPESVHHRKGASAIGYGEDDATIFLRVQNIKDALRRGHEIGSHAVGHWNGKNFSAEDWRQEFDSFDSILLSYGIATSSIKGFRAPELGVSAGLYTVLKERSFLYDTSKVGFAEDVPYIYEGLWQFPVKTIDFKGRKNSMLAMDYSIYAHQTGALDSLVKGTPAWDKAYNDVYAAYSLYFTKNYEGVKSPVYIAHHFSKWNDGLYWEVMKNLARDVCGKEGVACVTYGELQSFLQAQK
jgi:peptidoglycan/xylan/chitin deacetylase (PgdA/CDA1 family)